MTISSFREWINFVHNLFEAAFPEPGVTFTDPAGQKCSADEFVAAHEQAVEHYASSKYLPDPVPDQLWFELALTEEDYKILHDCGVTL